MYSYRWTFITGLCIYGVGALMFWPSAVYRSFGGFCGSLFIVGSGLSTLETSANPFIATCGPPRLSEFRLELSQSFQAVSDPRESPTFQLCLRSKIGVHGVNCSRDTAFIKRACCTPKIFQNKQANSTLLGWISHGTSSRIQSVLH